MEPQKKLKLIIVIIASVLVAISLTIFRKNIIDQVQTNGEEKLSGRWAPARIINHGSVDEQTHDKLISLGYLDGYHNAPAIKNVTVYKKNLTHNGLNFYVSGHAPEAFIIDMEGNVLHTWHFKNAADIWPHAKDDVQGGKQDQLDFKTGDSYWRRAYLFKNGDLLVIYEGIGIIKINKDSNLLWSYTSDKKPHHDLEVTADGYIYILTRETKEIKKFYHEKPFLQEINSLKTKNASKYIREDFITILDNSGKAIKHISLLDLIKNSHYRGLIDNIKNSNSPIVFGAGDLLHTNTLEVFNGKLKQKSSLFNNGNLLVSFLAIDTIAIIDKDVKRIEWALGSGMWRRQHQPTLLDNGNMLIFNNRYTDNSSSVIEFEPFLQEIIWEYKGQNSSPFFSVTCGSNQRLPNGNTLITETDNGRVFEVTKDKEIVWEFINPYRAGKKKELIATIPEMLRLSNTYCEFIKK